MSPSQGGTREIYHTDREVENLMTLHSLLRYHNYSKDNN